MLNKLKIDREIEDSALNTIFFDNGEHEGRPIRVSKVNYLAFLSMKGNEASEEISKLTSLLDKFPKDQIEDDLIKLFCAVNWRFHDISSVFVALGFHSQKVFEALWSRIEEGSWVSPQLVATAYFVDQNFERRAIALINSESTYYKSIISLAEILDEHLEGKNISKYSPENLKKAKDYDRDNSGSIALGWLRSLRESIA